MPKEPKEVMGFSLEKEVANKLRERYPSNMSYFVNKILKEHFKKGNTKND